MGGGPPPRFASAADVRSRSSTRPHSRRRLRRPHSHSRGPIERASRHFRHSSSSSDSSRPRSPGNRRRRCRGTFARAAGRRRRGSRWSSRSPSRRRPRRRSRARSPSRKRCRASRSETPTAALIRGAYEAAVVVQSKARPPRPSMAPIMSWAPMTPCVDPAMTSAECNAAGAGGGGGGGGSETDEELCLIGSSGPPNPPRHENRGSGRCSSLFR